MHSLQLNGRIQMNQLPETRFLRLLQNTLATRRFWLAVGIIVAVIIVVVASGINVLSFHLSDQVLMALIGLTAIVVRYAFSSK